MAGDVPAAPGGTTAVSAMKDVYSYAASNFDGRFDGEVNRLSGMVTLSVRVKWLHTNSEWNGASDSNFVAYQQRFYKVVEAAWSGKYQLIAKCPMSNKALSCKVLVAPATDGNEHVTITVRDQTDNRVSGLYADPPWRMDLYDKNSTTKYNGAYKVSSDLDDKYQDFDEPAAPGSAEAQIVTYRRNTAVHEFGHLMGLKHPRPALKDSSNKFLPDYGQTYDEKNNVMGKGLNVSPANYEPFFRIARCYGKEKFPSSMVEACNVWKVDDGMPWPGDKK